jgi:uncharacterized phage protein (TIGR02218 family)
MKTISPALAAHLATGQCTLAYLWKVKRVNGTILGFTTHDQDIVYDDGSGDGSVTYLASTGFTNTATASKSDLSVDNLEVTAFLDSESITESDLRAHLYDNATISIRVVNWADLTMGHLTVKRGTLGVVKMAGGLATAEIRGLTHKLTSQIGSTYGPICRAEFGSGLNGIDMNSKWKCNVDVAALRVTTGLVGAFDTRTMLLGGPPGSFDGYYDNGILSFTSGVLSGQSFEIKHWLGGIFRYATLFLPLKTLPLAGDACTLEPGCNKTIFDCQNKFTNIVNFRGEPFLPGEDRILDYPNAN